MRNIGTKQLPRPSRDDDRRRAEARYAAAGGVSSRRARVSWCTALSIRASAAANHALPVVTAAHKQAMSWSQPTALTTLIRERSARMATPFGSLVDVETGEQLGPATALHLRYASRSSDNTLRIDAKGQPFANGSSTWLLRNTRRVQILGVPPGALGRTTEETAQTQAPARSHPKVLAQTSAAIGSVAWVAMRRQDLVNGVLAAIDLGGQRALVFSSDPERQLTIPDSAILQVTKVASGLNIIVDVLYGDLWSQTNMLCFVGPRGHMKTIFATVGHPI